MEKSSVSDPNPHWFASNFFYRLKIACSYFINVKKENKLGVLP
jgi:hypothetical protein